MIVVGYYIHRNTFWRWWDLVVFRVNSKLMRWKIITLAINWGGGGGSITLSSCRRFRFVSIRLCQVPLCEYTPLSGSASWVYASVRFCFVSIRLCQVPLCEYTPLSGSALWVYASARFRFVSIRLCQVPLCEYTSLTGSASWVYASVRFRFVSIRLWQAPLREYIWRILAPLRDDMLLGKQLVVSISEHPYDIIIILYKKSKSILWRHHLVIIHSRGSITSKHVLNSWPIFVRRWTMKMV